jgi:hypothetical protein
VRRNESKFERFCAAADRLVAEIFRASVLFARAKYRSFARKIDFSRSRAKLLQATAERFLTVGEKQIDGITSRKIHKNFSRMAQNRVHNFWEVCMIRCLPLCSFQLQAVGLCFIFIRWADDHSTPHFFQAERRLATRRLSLKLAQTSYSRISDFSLRGTLS